MRIRVQPSVVFGALLSGILVAACAGGLGPSDAQDSDEGAGIPASATPQMERGPRDFKVPEDAAQVVNPVQADEMSLQRGKEVFESSCSECHGEEGRGDGPKAPAYDPAPLDYRDPQVVALTDGELFYIISNGVKGTGMSSHLYFAEEDRWHLVNYIRGLQR